VLTDGRHWIFTYLVRHGENGVDSVQMFRTKKLIADSQDNIEILMGTPCMSLVEPLGLLVLFCVKFNPKDTSIVTLKSNDDEASGDMWE